MTTLVRSAMLVVACLMAVPAAHADDDPALADADSALARWDVTAAREAIDRASDGAAKDVKQGVLLVHEGSYADAEQALAEALAGGTIGQGSELEDEAKHYLALARGSQRALADAVVVDSDDGLFRATFASAQDALIAPYLFDAMAEARAVLGRELGVVPDHTVRFEFLDDPHKLAMVTPLTVQNIRTTGTVGVTKHRRVVMITPRVMLRGYAWIDTAVHEYVHYLLTLRTGNRAPVWLHEGLAKLYETRWRQDEPDPLDGAIAFRLHQAIVRDDLVTFDEMYPSVAMLPTAEEAALAYAEVETMLGLLRERKGVGGISSLLDRVAAGDDAEEALATAWGDDFDSFFAEWKRVTSSRTARGRKGAIEVPTFKEGDGDPDVTMGDVFSHLGGGKARQHARLGTLLQSRKHEAAAAGQYEKARRADARARRDPELARRLGRLYVTLERHAEAVPLLEIAATHEPDDPDVAAAEARARLRGGDSERARAAARRAIRVNPFVPMVHCDLAELATDEVARARERTLCRE